MIAFPENHEVFINRLGHPSTLKFPNYFQVTPEYEIYTVNKEDIFSTNPAVFIWVDLGIQQLQPMTTSTRQMAYVDHQVFDVPIRDFKDSDKDHSHLLMISVNLATNRHLLSKQDIKRNLEELDGYAKRFKEVFTGENRNG